MSIKDLLGLSGTGISEFDVVSRISEAQKKGLEEIDFQLADGSSVKVLLPLF